MILIPDKNYSFSIISNGFLISPDIIKLFKEMKLQHIQITLDGLKETHNKIKFTKNENDTFSRTIKNIDLLASSAPEIRISIRVNMNKENSSEFITLYSFILQRYKSNPLIGIYPAFITSTSSKSSSSCSLLFNRQEKSEFIQQLYYDRGIVTNLCGYPDSSFTECSIRNKHTFTIDPEGYLYKCWEIIGDQKYANSKIGFRRNYSIHRSENS